VTAAGGQGLRYESTRNVQTRRHPQQGQLVHVIDGAGLLAGAAVIQVGRHTSVEVACILLLLLLLLLVVVVVVVLLLLLLLLVMTIRHRVCSTPLSPSLLLTAPPSVNGNTGHAALLVLTPPSSSSSSFCCCCFLRCGCSSLTAASLFLFLGGAVQLGGRRRWGGEGKGAGLVLRRLGLMCVCVCM